MLAGSYTEKLGEAIARSADSKQRIEVLQVPE
jgi:hypothetical protein